MAAATTLKDVVFCAILRRQNSDARWVVASTSEARHCRVATVVSIPPGLEAAPIMAIEVDPARDIAFPCAKNARQIIITNFPSFSASERGMLILGRTSSLPLSEEDETFLRALTMQAQLALHNALLFHERERQIEELKVFKEIQNTFFTSAAHELKTPLTVIGLLSSGLGLTIKEPSAEQREMLETMGHSVARLQALAANILATARLEANDVVLQPRAIDVGRLVAMVADEMKTVLGGKGLSIVLDPPGIWPKTWADPNRIREVLFNLLSNAAKFAEPDGPIVIRFSAEKDMATIGVCDRGKEISQRESELVFDKYFTGKDVGALAGAGLGLYITRQLVALHRGAIWVESGEGKTCFHFTLPLAREGENYE